MPLTDTASAPAPAWGVCVCVMGRMEVLEGFGEVAWRPRAVERLHHSSVATKGLCAASSARKLKLHGKRQLQLRLQHSQTAEATR